MSSLENLKNDLRVVKDHWNGLDSKVRFLDLVTIAAVAMFGVSFFFVYLFDIPLIITNSALVIYPAVIAGFTFVLRSQLNDENADHEKARKDYLWTAVVITLIVLSTFLYAPVIE